jgi:hypothetical protein
MESLYSDSQVVDKKHKVYITDYDFPLLSKFEKGTLKVLGEMMGLIKEGGELDYGDVVNIFNKLTENKTDYERSYLLGLFFPEKVRGSHVIYPFPIPTFTYVQKFQHFITPNVNGCFLVQAVCPLLLDNSSTNNTTDSERSNLYVNSGSSLNGRNGAGEWTAIVASQVPTGVFTTAVLQSMKIGVRYVGRSDVISGYFGGSINIQSGSIFSSYAPDTSTVDFNVVDDGINAQIADVTEGMNVVYYPPDYSYLQFLKVNTDPTGSGGNMSTNVRLHIYGNSLPPSSLGGSSGVILSYNCVWNCIPRPIFADLLPTDHSMGDQTLDIIELGSFIPKARLGTFKNSDIGKIDRMLGLPMSLRQDAIKDLSMSDNKSKTILDVLDPLVGDSLNTAGVKIDRNLLEQLVLSGNRERKKNIDAMNNNLKKIR